MPKNIEDIIPSERRKSIRDIPLPDRRRTTRDVEPAKSHKRKIEPILPRLEPEAEEVDDKDRVIVERRTHNRRHSSKKNKLAMIGAGLLLIAFVAMSMFSGATLAYTPKAAKLSFNKEVYTAYKNGEGDLLFSVVKLSGDKGKEVSASGERDVAHKASGQIIVYNKQTSSQTLIEETRFQTSDGKIYKLPLGKGIVVPAGGSLEVTVYADQPGASYNIGLVDFTLPGLKGTPRFTTVYARSKTPMTGGFVGKEKSVSEAELSVTRATLDEELSRELIEQARAQVPEDFVLFPHLATVTYEDLPQSNVTNSSVTVNRRGNFYGVMFKKSDLARFLTSKKAVVVQSDQVEIEDIESLDLAFAGTVPADLLQVNELNFTVEGQVLAMWITNADSLKSELTGRNKNDISEILKNYPSIAQANAYIRPFWKSSFPDDADKITLKKLTPQ